MNYSQEDYTLEREKERVPFVTNAPSLTRLIRSCKCHVRRLPNNFPPFINSAPSLAGCHFMQAGE